MTKLPDWQDRLTYLVSEVRGIPFTWGKLDCCLWAAACVEAQTGVDHAAAWRGAYSDAKGGLRVLRHLGGLRGVGALLGSPVPPLTARDGDIGVVRVNNKPLLGLCTGANWLAVSTLGLTALPFNSASMAWRV